ncbi:MAG: acyltransferase, partial [Planctomycetaceae bacterium]|nr:acyltransferase [Planctomycetaceae bacterium]
MSRHFNIALVQVSLNGTPDENLIKCLDWVRTAAGEGGQVICLPELYSSFYFCQKETTKYFEFAEPLYDKSFTAFSKLAEELGVVIIVPFFEKRTEGLYH